MSSSDEVESNEINDCDTGTTTQLFDESLRIASEESISLEQDYILYLDNSSNFERIAAATSSRMVHLFDLNSSKGFTQIQRYNDSSFNAKDNSSICGIRFSKKHPNSLFVAEASGNIYLYDIRSKPTHVQTFQADAIDTVKPYTCFDMNADESLLCAGTEKTQDECHLKLFDVRKWSTLTTFTDSHSQDFTQVKFHPNKRNVLASGSTDGLINIFNVTETNEDDALEYCVNTESSVQTINWHLRNSDMEDSSVTGDLLTCITDTHDFQLIDVDESEIIFQAKRNQIVKHMMRTNEDECYLSNCHSAMNGDIFLLAGSHGNAGECLRSLNVRHKSFEPRNNFNGNKQIVRCSVFNSKNNTLITAGEGGIITLWENFKSSKVDGHKLKDKVDTKSSRKSKPY